MVGNVEELQCTSHCPRVPLYLHTTQIFYRFSCITYLSSRDCADGSRLELSRPVITDCCCLTMKIFWNKKLVKLCGEQGTVPDQVNLYKLKRLVSTASIEASFHRTKFLPTLAAIHQSQNLFKIG